ncbi:MAG: ABC transporter permease, partial [Myxococcales bacterium]|nr:ABC transporter permease [Myxococcales bacterium]
MKALDRKLWRDLQRMGGQALTIAAVMAVGIACFIALRGNYGSLQAARNAYYERARFADVFAHLERAPESVAMDLEAVEAVARVETRVVETGKIPLPGVAQPIVARLVSLPVGGKAALNSVALTTGRMVEADGPDEVVVLAAFAQAHGLEPGDHLNVVINGKLRDLRIVGLAKSPEYLVSIAPGDMAPEPGRFAVLWLDRDMLATAFNMEGAFNDVVFALQPGASRPAVLAAVDRVLEPHGGVGAVPRDKQASSYFVDGELMQLEAMGTSIPAIFLAVAALLINIVLSRMVHLQRPQIATLKALGYDDLSVGLHFGKLIGVIAIFGSIVGVALGVYLGQAMLRLYAEFFDFPNLRFVMDPGGAALAILISTGSAGLGALVAIRTVVAMVPAEAMRPAAPARYRRSLLDRLGLGVLVGPAVTMVVRELWRRPLRTATSSLAIAASVGLMVVGGWYADGIEEIMQIQFHDVMREDVSVVFLPGTDDDAIRDLAHLPGVLEAEGLRVVPVRFHNGPRHRDGSIFGYPDDIEMRALRDQLGKPQPLPPEGLVLTDKLAEILGVKVGDSIEIKVDDGSRGRYEVVVTGTVAESFGLQGHMRLPALQRVLGEERIVSLGLMRVDPKELDELDARLRDAPSVMGVTRVSTIVERFREQSARMILVFSAVITIFAATITIGVVYNNARISLNSRQRDLASMRILGFTKAEIGA